MEKITQTNNTTNNNSTLLLQNRKNLKLDGIKEVLRSNNTEIYLKMNDTTLIITGSNISIHKVDTNEGSLEASGIFNTFTYGTKPNLLKRIFK